MKGVIALLGRAIVFELALYRSLFRWITRRRDVPAGAVAFAYLEPIAALLWVFIVVSAVELFVLHVVIPWETLRIIADALGVWGLIWMLGLMASFKVYPHVVGDTGLRVRHGFSTNLAVPWDAIATIGVRERGRDKSRALQLDRDEDGAVLNVVIGKRTNVDVTLRRPLAVPLRKGAESITELRLFADDPRDLVSRVREYLKAGEETALSVEQYAVVDRAAGEEAR